MSEAFDPYYELLGIRPEEQPPHHYRLLGVSLFETNASVISNAAARQMSYVRSFGAGDHEDAMQKLLNELAAAKLCLLRPQDKEAYDQKLRSTLGKESGKTTEINLPIPPPVSPDEGGTVLFPPPPKTNQPRPATPSAGASPREKSWVVGSSEGCDIIVKHPTVSRIHCRLTKKDDAMFVEDLRSRNGTFVNRARITGRVAVSPLDLILLGNSVPFPWPPECVNKVGDSVIRIGRDAANDVVLDDASVSAHHARILIRSGGMTLEDMGSSNGTFVGSPDRRIHKCTVTEDDVVYFGKKASRTVRDLLKSGVDKSSRP